MTRHIPIQFLMEPLAVKPKDACRLLAVCRKTLWHLTSTKQIKATRYGTIPITELQRHLMNEVKR